jgi:hypothetical protein
MMNTRAEWFRWFGVLYFSAAVVFSQGCKSSKRLGPDSGGAAAGSGGESGNPDVGTSSWAGAGGSNMGGTSTGGTGKGGIGAGGTTSAAGAGRTSNGGAGAGGTSKGGTTSRAGECGATGQICCDGNTCTSGGCCVLKICVGSGQACAPIPGTCQDGTCGSCGGRAQPCCATDTSSTVGTSCTAPGTYCASGLCTLCGTNPGEPCCYTSGPAGTSSTISCLSSDLICSDYSFTPAHAPVCLSCGKPGTPCCAGSRCEENACCYNEQCVAETTACAGLTPGTGGMGGTNGGVCTAGHCSGCGALGQPCCGSTCGAGLTCGDDGTCVACGGPGEDCCSVALGHDRCTAGTACVTGKGLLGQGGTCTICGGPGGPCCYGSKCDGGCCLLGTCTAEGSTCGDSSGFDYGQCKSGRCICGNEGQTCCLSGTFPIGNDCSSRDLVCSTNSQSTSGAGACVACGKNNTPCCRGGTCTDPGTQCVRDLGITTLCKPCGETDQVCCPNATDSQPACKKSGSYCDGNNICKMCGTPGAPCCPGNICTNGCCVTGYGRSSFSPTCIAPGSSCEMSTSVFDCNVTNPTTGSCQSGAETCGGLGQDCCYSKVYLSVQYRYCAAQGSHCLPSTTGTPSRDVCTACGDLGQACCTDNRSTGWGCKSPYRCTYTDSYICTQPPALGTSTSTDRPISVQDSGTP